MSEQNEWSDRAERDAQAEQDESSAFGDRDLDPNLDEYTYEHRVDDAPGLQHPGGSADGRPGGDEHADNPHPDADGDVTRQQTGNDPTGTITDPDRPDPDQPDDPTGVIDPDAD